MATLHASTTSDGATVSNADAVRELCRDYHFNGLNWDVSGSKELTIWGDQPFDLYLKREEGDPDHSEGIRTRQFLRRLATYIERDNTLDIMTVGHTKCRYPHLAQRYVVKSDGVYYTDLSPVEPIEESNPLSE